MWPFSGHQGFARELSVHRGEPVTVPRQEWRTTLRAAESGGGTWALAIFHISHRARVRDRPGRREAAGDMRAHRAESPQAVGRPGRRRGATGIRPDKERAEMKRDRSEKNCQRRVCVRLQTAEKNSGTDRRDFGVGSMSEQAEKLGRCQQQYRKLWDLYISSDFVTARIQALTRRRVGSGSNGTELALLCGTVPSVTPQNAHS